ncbi:MAG: CFI-box-CTERM domain-containing protein [Candidatus Bathyarchaeia archaeon]
MSNAPTITGDVELFSRNILSLLCLLVLVTAISFVSDSSKCESIELLENGGFEEGMSGWRGFSYCDQLPREGVVTDYLAHSGRCSLYTLCGTGGEHCYGVGGGATQEIRLNQRSNLTLQFSVYIFGTSQVNAWIDIALIADFWVSQTKKTLVYYVTWTENTAIYRDYPLPKMTSENVKNILIYGIESYEWNNVRRDVYEDLRQTYPSISPSSIEGASITLLAVTFQRLTSVPAGAFWDDISITCTVTSALETESQPSPTTPTTSPIPKPEPTSSAAPKTNYSCIIATVAYGSELAPEVAYMRHVRDDMLGSNEVGRMLVDAWNTFYYSWSPPIAKCLENSETLRALCRASLMPLSLIVHSSAFIYAEVASIDPSIASIVAFIFAAVISTMTYAVIPLVLLQSTLKKRLRSRAELDL